MKILVDMNFSPEWLKVLEQAGWQANHWTAVGSSTAPDTDHLDWARQHGWVLLGPERSTVLFRDPANAGRRLIPLLLAAHRHDEPVAICDLESA